MFSTRKLWKTAVSLLIGVILVLPVQAEELVYSFRTYDGMSGGVALIDVDSDTGAIKKHEIICEDGRLVFAKKVRYNKKADRIVITNEGAQPPFVFLSKTDPPSLTGPVEIETLCDEVRPYGKKFIASCDKGRIVLFNGKNGEEEETFKARKKLKPPGNRPEDIVVLKDDSVALFTFQKDNSDGSRRGNRLIALSLPDLKLKGDVELPRDHEELHVPGFPKLSGPGPEVLIASEDTGTALVTLDFYGGVGFIDISDIIKGKDQSYESKSVALDKTWGTAFPDRASLIEDFGLSMALVTNAGKKGGTHLFDLETRETIAAIKTPPGLEAPVYLPSTSVAVSVCSGKTKFRKGNEIIKEYHPDKNLYIFDFSQVDKGKVPLSSKRIGVEGLSVAAVNPEESPFVLVASSDAMLVINSVTGEIIDESPAKGAPQRIEPK